VAGIYGGLGVRADELSDFMTSTGEAHGFLIRAQNDLVDALQADAERNTKYLWNTFLNYQDIFFDRFELHPELFEGRRSKALRDRVVHWRSKKCSGIIHYARNARNTQHHGLVPIAQYQSAHVQYPDATSRFGYGRIENGSISVAASVSISPRGVQITSGTLSVKNGKVIEASGHYTISEEVPNSLRLFPVKEKNGNLVPVPKVSNFIAESEMALFFSCFIADFANYVMDELTSLES
jgi:hypothetical protein